MGLALLGLVVHLAKLGIVDDQWVLLEGWLHLNFIVLSVLHFVL